MPPRQAAHGDEQPAPPDEQAQGQPQPPHGVLFDEVPVRNGVGVLPGERVVADTPHHLRLLGEVGLEAAPVEQGVRLGDEKGEEGHSESDGRPGHDRAQPVNEIARRVLAPGHAKQVHQLGNAERQKDGQLAGLGRQPEPHKEPRQRRVAHAAFARDPVHEEKRNDGEHGLQRVHREVVAELDVQDRDRKQACGH